jgi:hypothetical protein
LPNRKDVKDVVGEEASKIRKKVKAVLATTVGKICFTIDLYKCEKLHMSFLGIIGTFFVKNSTKSILLSVKGLHAEHTGELIEAEFLRVYINIVYLKNY